MSRSSFDFDVISGPAEPRVPLRALAWTGEIRSGEAKQEAPASAVAAKAGSAQVEPSER